MKSIKYKSLPEKTANVLLDYLYRENYPVGAKLPNEIELADQFEVSRNTIRKAIQILVDKKILDVKRGSGTFVASNRNLVDDPLGLTLCSDDKKLARDLLDVRLMIEPKTAALAAENASTEDIRQLQTICKKLDKAIESGQNYYEIDIEFHTFLAGCSKNLVIHNLYPAITRAIILQESIITKRFGETTSKAHWNIYEAIKNHCATDAAYAMQVHLIQNKQRL